MKLILVRHGHVEGIEPARFRGQKEISLTELGKAQAQATAKRIAAEWKIDAIYSSPLHRCSDTAREIGHAQRLIPCHMPELLDFDYGEWAWKTHEEVRQSSPALYDLWFSAPHLAQIPGGDTLQSLASRSADCLRFLLDAHQGQTVVAVGHDSINRALLLQLLDLPLSAYWRIRQNPACINEIDVRESVTVHRVNEHGHLLGLDEGLFHDS